jgi:hypothetical protein
VARGAGGAAARLICQGSLKGGKEQRLGDASWVWPHMMYRAGVSPARPIALRTPLLRHCGDGWVKLPAPSNTHHWRAGAGASLEAHASCPSLIGYVISCITPPDITGTVRAQDLVARMQWQQRSLLEQILPQQVRCVGVARQTTLCLVAVQGHQP